jgi:hypothetical protein
LGLDSFLFREHYIGGKYRTGEDAVGGSVKDGVDITVTEPNGEIRQIKLDAGKIHTILEDVTYWRKANQIHGWITEGYDDDTHVYIDGERLIELRETCQKVIDFLENQERVTKYGKHFNETFEYKGFKDESLAIELLPPKEGFFFGSYVIDDDYLADLKDTVEALKDIDPNDSFLYEASY